MRAVEIPEDLYRRLQNHARPFEDEPADIIDRALDALEATKDGTDSEASAEEMPDWKRKLMA